MATIGTFIKRGDDLHGAIRTLTLDVDLVMRPVPKTRDGPDFLIYAAGTAKGPNGIRHPARSRLEADLRSRLPAHRRRGSGRRAALVNVRHACRQGQWRAADGPLTGMTCPPRAFQLLHRASRHPRRMKRVSALLRPAILHGCRMKAGETAA